MFHALRFMRTHLWTLLVVLVGLGRIELPTSPLSGVRSSRLSYRPKTFAKLILFSWLCLVELVGIEPATS